MQESRQNHTSAASGVAYAETRGANNLLNWTEAGPKILFTSAGLRNRTCSSGMSAPHVQEQGHVITEQGLEFMHETDVVDGRSVQSGGFLHERGAFDPNFTRKGKRCLRDDRRSRDQ